MTKQVQRRRGTATQHTSFTGAEGEISVNTTNKSIHVHDGVTAGGIEGARADMTNVSDGDLNSRLAGNTLSSLTITSADINGGTIDGTVIGGSTPAAGSFTNISATGTIDGRDVAADGSKLDGIEAGADVTDTANVTAAGALMDSELTDITAVKALDQGVATTDDPTFTNTQLAAIAESKGVTAVDVFVYDTSKDSDGGAWRKRTQGTSWYNETLNTATRGSRREFPAVTVIVAESNKVTIYDGDDPALPMWMVFNNASANAIKGDTKNTCYAKNGELCIGQDLTGLIQIKFISDKVDWRISTSYYTYNSTVSGRNDAAGFTSLGSAGVIVNSTLNDVAMTVLPDAPIDPATGLPVPTIAVATDGGVSVIKDDGTVVDLTYSISSNEAGKVWLPASGGIEWTSRIEQGGYVYIYRENTIPSADKSTEPDARYGNFFYTPSISDLTFVGNTSFDAVEGAVASDEGFTHLDENPTTPANGMVAYTTSTYNTGWMNGDIKGAFLSDTDDTDLTYTALNNTTDYTTEWVQTEDGWTLNATSLVCNGVDALEYAYAAGLPNLSVGDEVVIKLTISSYTSGSLFVSFASGSASTVAMTSNGSFTFTGPLTANATIYLRSENFAGTVTDIEISKTDADRSVNNKGLIVNGTVTRTFVDEV